MDAQDTSDISWDDYDLLGPTAEALGLLESAIAVTVSQLRETPDFQLPSAPRPTESLPSALYQMLAIQRLQVELENQLHVEARRALREGLPYSSIGAAVGISRQRAHARFSGPAAPVPRRLRRQEQHGPPPA